MEDIMAGTGLSAEQMDDAVRGIPGGARNVQDVYPLSPLQEGMLFHHLLSESDTYVLSTLLKLKSRNQAEAFVAAVQTVIDRHDSLRTAVIWEGVSKPVQVVCRQVALPVQEFTLERDIDAVTQLRERMRPGRLKMNLQRAPLVRLEIASGAHDGRCYALLYVHHLICDHQSLQLAVAEAIACLEGRLHELPAPASYRNYVTHATSRSAGQDAEVFFRRKLADVDGPTAPFGLLDVHSDGMQIEEAQQTLDVELSDQIRIQARRLGMSPARLFHAAWGLVVAATTGLEDVVFGTVLLTAQQRSAIAQRMLGLSVNTLPLRLRVRDLTAQEFAEYANRELSELLTYEQTPLTQAQRCSGIVGAAPLFTSLFNFRRNKAEQQVEQESDAGVRVLARSEAWTNYPITIIVDDLGQSFQLTAQTDRRVDPDRLIAYLSTAIRSLTNALRDAPHTPAVDVGVLPDAERRLLIEQFNPKLAERLPENLIHQLFEAQVKRNPKAVAVVYEEESLTYAELNGKANQLAHYLRERGVGRDQLVGICVERGLEMVIGLLGILKAGGAYVPLDPSYPKDRLQHILDDAAPRVLLTQERLRSMLPAGNAEIIALDSHWHEISRQSSRNVDARSTALWPSHLAYVIYTSGSTGRPKGVMVEHRNVSRLFAATEQWFHFNHRDVWTLFHSFAFDFSVWELWGALTKGGRVVVVPQLTARSPEAFYRLVCKEGVTVLNQTPSAFAQFINAQAQDETSRHSLRVVIFGGEALELHTLRPWVRRNGAARPELVNMYGITETTVHVTYRPPLTEEEIESERGSLIGQPISDLRVYVLDRHLRPSPVGVVGEMYVGGAGVARGYLNRTDLTLQRFVHDPFSADPRARLYKTGDLARWRADGELEYLGRNDHQVKIRGFRIELGEIEAQLARHPRVREVVVIAREDVKGEKRLVAYLSAFQHDAAPPPTAEELRAHLKGVLPDYMVPSAFVMLDHLPLTVNGKLDRRALPVPDLVAYTRRQYQAPQGELEQTLASIWQDLLRVERVGRNDNFFELGGHSLLIMQVMERLRRIGLSTEVRRIFESPSLADLARTLQRESTGQFKAAPNLIPASCDSITPQMLTLIELNSEQIERIVATVPGGAENVQDIYPLAPSQEGILFHHLFDERSGDSYVLVTVLTVSSRDRLEELVSALQNVIDRNDILRTSILWEQLPQPVQVVHRRATLPVEQLRWDPGCDPAEEVRKHINPERQHLDLRRAPLMRLQVAEDPKSGRWYAFLQLHHMAIDHVTLEIVVTEAVAHLEGQAAMLPEPVPYRNHVAYSLSQGKAHEAEQFFRRKLGGISKTTAPFDLLDVRGGAARIEEAVQPLDSSLASSIRVQTRRLGISAAALFHAAWSLVVARTSDSNDVVFGSVLLGRLQGGGSAQRTLGMLINTLPLRVQLHGLTARQLADQTHRELIELLGHEQASLAVAQRCSDLGPAESLFTSILNYRHSIPQPETQWSGARGVCALSFQERTNYPIAVSVDDLAEGFVLTAQTDKRIDPTRITAYVETAVQALVTALEEDPERLALALPILPRQEVTHLVETVNATRRPYPADRSIQELFEDWTQRTPNAVAVRAEGESLTYAQLNERANQLAHHLGAQGVQAGDYVPVVMPRGLQMIVAQLAVLKCGGTYVPIDPELPSKRLAFMIEDCHARHIIADRQSSEGFAREGLQWIDCSASASAVEQCSQDNLDLHLASPPPAYVMYTSGSTGQPKGVVVPHRAVVRLAIDNGYAEITPSDCLAGCSNPAFDASTFETWGALLNGARVAIVPQRVLLEALPFVELLRRERVTAMFLTVGLFNQYALALAGLGSQMRCLMTGGDVVEPEVVRRIFRKSAGPSLRNAYGPTECTTFSTTHAIENLADDATGIPIGRPISNTQIYILNGDLQPVPVGVPGEIYIGGDGVALGYLNRPELTAERFVADPFAGERAARMYKSGDRAWWTEDGEVEFLGRYDHQVKIRGYRIELGEIESRLLQHSRIREAVVLAREEESGNKRLVAYVATGEEGSLSADEMRAHVAATLPEYMVPSVFVVLDRFPLTPNGKLDRRALPAPESDAYVRRHYESPRGETEETLAAIWRALLRVERIGRDDNFFELGGHSLLAMQGTVRIQSALFVELPIRMVFESPTIRQLAMRVEELRQRQFIQVIADGGKDVEDLLDNLASMSESRVDDLMRELTRGAHQ